MEPPQHPIWASGKLKYTSSNKWQSIPNERRKLACRDRVHGVEVRTLPVGHFLAGEEGLFATRKFLQFDIIGEYTGKVVGQEIFGHYVASLEDKELGDSLGVDASHFGNEMRFINSYMNIDFGPNVAMKTVHINTYIHILIVCTKDIEIDDEILLDYGESYNQAYLTAKPMITTPMAAMLSELRQMKDDNSDDDITSK